MAISAVGRCSSKSSGKADTQPLTNNIHQNNSSTFGETFQASTCRVPGQPNRSVKAFGGDGRTGSAPSQKLNAQCLIYSLCLIIKIMMLRI